MVIEAGFDIGVGYVGAAKHAGHFHIVGGEARRALQRARRQGAVGFIGYAADGQILVVGREALHRAVRARDFHQIGERRQLAGKMRLQGG